MKLIVSVNFIVTLPPVGVQNATYREREFLSLGLIVCTLLTSRQEAQLPQRNRAMRYVNKFVLCFTSYGTYKGFKQQR